MKNTSSIKRAFLVSFFCFHACLIFSQTSKAIFKSTVSEFLEDGDIIEDQSTIDRMPEGSEREKNRKIKAQQTHDHFINQFKMPIPFDDFKIESKYKYPQLPLSSIGGLVFDNESLPIDNNQIINRRLPQLLISDNLTQVSLETVSDNNYELNINLLSYMNWALKGSAGTEYLGIAKAKTEVAVQKTFDNKRSISVAYGYFKNSLATIFNEVNTTERIAKSNDFAPLFDLWLNYAINPERILNKYVIEGFNALIVEQNTNAVFLGGSNASVMAELNVNIPYLSLNSRTDAKWKKESEMRNKIKTVSVYFNGEPNFVKIPSIEKIYKTWEDITQNTYNDVIYEEGNVLIISNFSNSNPIVRVPFGPLPSTEYKSDIDVRVVASKGNANASYIKAIKINNTNPTTADNVDKGIYYLPISLTIDESMVRSNAKISSNVLISIPIEVFYKKSCIVNGQSKFLSKVYQLNVNLYTGAGVKFSSIKADSVANGINWNGEFLTSQPVEKLELIGIDFGISKLDNYEQVLLEAHELVKDSRNSNKWNLMTKGSLLNSTINFGDMTSATFTFRIVEKVGSLPLTRITKTLRFPLKYEAKSFDVPIEIVRLNIEDLVKLVPDSARISDGRNAKSVLQDTTTSKANKQKVYEELIKRKVIKIEGKNYKIMSSL